MADFLTSRLGGTSKLVDPFVHTDDYVYVLSIYGAMGDRASSGNKRDKDFCPQQAYSYYLPALGISGSKR